MLTTDQALLSYQARTKDGDSTFVHVARLPPGVRLEDAPASFFAGTALGGTGRFGSYAAPQVGPNPNPNHDPNPDPNPDPDPNPNPNRSGPYAALQITSVTKGVIGNPPAKGSAAWLDGAVLPPWPCCHRQRTCQGWRVGAYPMQPG